MAAQIPISGLKAQVAVADGSAAAPSISFSNDVNTGFYRPGSDTVGVVTGGVERMRVGSDGRTMVGTTSSAGTEFGTLQIKSGSSNPALSVCGGLLNVSLGGNADHYARLTMGNTDNAGNMARGVQFDCRNIGAFGYGSRLDVRVRQDNGSDLGRWGSEDMMKAVLSLTHSSVGIGTTNPRSALHVKTTTDTLTFDIGGGVGDGLLIESSATSSTKTDAYLNFWAKDRSTSGLTSWGASRLRSGWELSAGTAWTESYLAIETHATNTNAWTTDMVVKAGNVGIGSTNPSRLLSLGPNGAGFPTPSGSAPLYACRAFATFNGTTLSPTSYTAGNVASITRSATGRYSIGFTTAMPNSDYAVIATAIINFGTQLRLCGIHSLTTTGFGINTVSEGMALNNADIISFAVFAV